MFRNVLNCCRTSQQGSERAALKRRGRVGRLAKFFGAYVTAMALPPPGKAPRRNWSEQYRISSAFGVIQYERGRAGTMPAATTIVVAREDFSIPGGEYHDDGDQSEPMALESRFFNLLRESKPDVVVLDLRQANGDGVSMILKIRRQSSVPILVVCGPENDCAQDYRFAGAAECIASPVDVVAFNEVLQQIVRVNGQTATTNPREAEAIEFSGAIFRPHQNLMLSPDGKAVHLTTAESLLLAHFVANPWEIQTRNALA